MADEADLAKRDAYRQQVRRLSPKTYEEKLWAELHKGVPREEAIYRADEWERRQKGKRQ